MKPLLLFFTLLYCASCTSSHQASDMVLPEIVYQHPLPPFPKPVTTPTLRIDLKIHVAENGTVPEVLFLEGSGSDDWDSSAASAIRKWKYSPARYQEKPVSIWLHQTAVIQFSEPHYLLLAEILCTTTEEADSAYALLEQGWSFSDVAEKYSVASSRSTYGRLGTVNIQIYPQQIKILLSRLDREQYTSPVKYGERYAIFMRLKE